MVLDECPKLTNDKLVIKKSLDLSLNWAASSKEEFGDNPDTKLYLVLFKEVYLKILD